eukprot:GHUV01012102.1.p1 GENE.GHUV01012102.1~~GHUV01012102.1.p1  ORF type:complete len:430 (+),score=83.49 GHUV01012102.1:290-1579(+)
MAAASHLAHPCPGQYRQCAGPGLSCLVQLSSTIGNRQLAVAPMALARSLQPAAAGSLAPPSRIQKQDSQLARQRKGHSRGNTTEPAQQQRRTQKQQAISQQQQPVWGYLTGTDTDTWTWDDDYNPGVRARAAAEAQHLPPTPRQQALAQREAAAAQQRPRVITRLPEHFSSKVLANGVLLLDKPPRWSSADVVRQLNTVLKVQKIGVGGPLDVQATGLLIVLFGAATRLTPKLEPLERTYTGVIQLGVSTTTYDSTGQAVQVNPWQHITSADIQQAAAKFQGEVMQVPCMWSSTKFKNRPLRWYAERGETVVREPKAVQIPSLEVWREQNPNPSGDSASITSNSSTSTIAPGQPNRSHGLDEVRFRVVASKGASMRVLAHDLGKALGCGAHLASLRREGIGGFSVETAWSLDVLLPLAKKYGKGFRSAI